MVRERAAIRNAIMIDLGHMFLQGILSNKFIRELAAMLSPHEFVLMYFGIFLLSGCIWFFRKKHNFRSNLFLNYSRSSSLTLGSVRHTFGRFTAVSNKFPLKDNERFGNMCEVWPISRPSLLTSATSRDCLGMLLSFRR